MNKNHIDFLSKDAPFFLSADERVHLDRCEVCRNEEESLKSLFQSLKEDTLRTRSEEYWKDQSAAIMQKIGEQPRYKEGWIPRFEFTWLQRPMTAALVMASVMTLFTVTLYLWDRNQPSEMVLFLDVDEDGLPMEGISANTVSLDAATVEKLTQGILADSVTGIDPASLDTNGTTEDLFLSGV